MSKTSRYRINALLCVLVFGHAIYRFSSEQAASASGLWTALVVAQAVLGLAGAVWFWSRSRGASI